MPNELFGTLLAQHLGKPGTDVGGIVEELRGGGMDEAKVATARLAGLDVNGKLYTNVELHAFIDGSFLAIAENQHGNDINFITGETGQLLAGTVSVH